MFGDVVDAGDNLLTMPREALGIFWGRVFRKKIEKRSFSTADSGPKYDPCRRKFYKNINPFVEKFPKFSPVITMVFLRSEKKLPLAMDLLVKSVLLPTDYRLNIVSDPLPERIKNISNAPSSHLAVALSFEIST